MSGNGGGRVTQRCENTCKNTRYEGRKIYEQSNISSVSMGYFILGLLLGFIVAAIMAWFML